MGDFGVKRYQWKQESDRHTIITRSVQVNFADDPSHVDQSCANITEKQNPIWEVMLYGR